MNDRIPGNEFYEAVRTFVLMLEKSGVDVNSRQVMVIMPMEDMRKLEAHFGMIHTRGIFETLRIQFRGIGK